MEEKRERRDKLIIPAFLLEMRRCSFSPAYFPQIYVPLFFSSSSFVLMVRVPDSSPGFPPPLFHSLLTSFMLSVGVQQPYKTGLDPKGCEEEWSTIWQTVLKHTKVGWGCIVQDKVELLLGKKKVTKECWGVSPNKSWDTA